MNRVMFSKMSKKNIVAYEDINTCRECGGKCCKNLPGVCYPEDFNNDEELIRKAIESGNYCLDCWEGALSNDQIDKYRTYYIRPSIKGKEGLIFHGAWNGECTFLLDNIGCTLSIQERPTECQMLEPNKDMKKNCNSHGYGKKGAALSWLKFDKLLNELMEEYYK